MIRRLHDLLRKTAVPALPRPAPPVAVIADLHGRADLLDAMLTRITDQPDAACARQIFVGDLIDRGPDSAAVLARVHDLCTADRTRTICLMGNHERMMLDFLNDPVGAGPLWIANGGADTLASFGLNPWGRHSTPHALAEDLRAAAGPTLLDWLAALPLFWCEGTLAVTHAGADPARSLSDQSPDRLLWGPRRREGPRRDGIWVAQGHKVVARPLADRGRIMTDTGAWRTGVLTAAWLDTQGLRFLHVDAGNDIASGHNP